MASMQLLTQPVIVHHDGAIQHRCYAQTPSSGFVLDLSKTCPLVASADTDLSVSGMS